MAKLTTLPSQFIIDGFKGKIDFYVCRGIPCARKWPYYPPRKPSPAEAAAQAVFSAAVEAWSALPSSVRENYRRWAAGSSLSARDLFIKGYIGGLYRYEKEITLLPQCFAYMSADLTNLVSGTDYQLPLDLEDYDIGDDWDTANYRFVAPLLGRYLVILNVGWNQLAAANDRYIMAKKNGGEVLTGYGKNLAAGVFIDTKSGIVQLSPGDLITAHVKHFCGVNTPDIFSYINWTNLSISMLA